MDDDKKHMSTIESLLTAYGGFCLGFMAAWVWFDVLR